MTERKKDTMLPSKIAIETAVGASRSAVAVHVTRRRWLSFFRFVAMHNSVLITITGLAGICFLTGCGTIFARTGNNDRVDFYPATDFDVLTISSGGDTYGGGHAHAGVFGWLVLVPFHVIDLPISLVTDTLCLPCDIEKNKQNKEVESRVFKMEVGVANTNVPEMILVATSYQHPAPADFSAGYINEWAMFRCIPSGETNKVTLFESFGCPGTVNRYKLNSVFWGLAYIEKQKKSNESQK